jgi:hypothetical protein
MEQLLRILAFFCHLLPLTSSSGCSQTEIWLRTGSVPQFRLEAMQWATHNNFVLNERF